MARPDLNDPTSRAEYRSELRAYLRPWRWFGLALAVAGGLWLALRDHNSPMAWAAFIIGWAILIAIIILRTRYHMRRMAEPA